MKVFENRIGVLAFVCVVIVCAFTSCRKESEDRAAMTTVDVVAGVTNVSPLKGDSAVISEKTVSRGEKFKAEFERLVVSSNMTVSATESAVNKLCWEIHKIQDKNEKLQLYDQLFEMAMSHNVAATDYYSRQNWYRALFYVAGHAFTFAQHLRKDSFQDWGKLFLFFKKYTDEITAVEKSLPNTDSRYWKWADLKKESYLRGLKGDLKMWVREIRDFHFPSLSEGLAEEQKADILRRFKEIEKFTVMPQRDDQGLPIQSTTNTPVNASGDGATKGSE